MNFPTFEQWRVEIETRLIRQHGLTTLDCPNHGDMPLWYYRGVEPKGAVRRLLESIDR